MLRLAVSIPSYRHHNASGKRSSPWRQGPLLGVWQSEASQTEHGRIVSQVAGCGQVV